MSQRDDLDFTTLNWVKRELDETLKQARQALEAFVDNPTDPTQMRFCASYLHQVQGTLRMVELYGAAQVSEEMERLAQAILDGKAKSGEDTYTVLMRGIVQLPDYLERLQGGHKDIPIVLLPLLNDLRSARGEGLLSETALFSPNLYVDLPAQAAGAASPLPEGELKTQAARLRGAFQTSLVRWFRDDEPEAMLARLFAVLERLRSLCHVTEARRLWWIASVVVDGIKHGAIEVNLTVKLLFGKVDREIKHLVDSGEPSFRAAPANDLVKNLLYYIAHAAPDTARTRLVKATYGLSTLIPDAAELEHAKGSLAGRNRALLDTVGNAIKEDLLRVKEGLDLHLRSGAVGGDLLKPLAQQLGQIGDTLGMLGLGVPRKVVQEQKEIIERMTLSQERSDENALLDVAGALLFVEASLDDHIHMLGGPATADQAAEPTSAIPQAEMRKIMDQTMREAATNLQLAKENIVAFIESPWDHERLNDTPRLLDEVVGALRVMQHVEAGNLLDGVKRFIHAELVEKRQVPNARQLDTLADALVSIEYYLEALKEQRPGREKGLEVARRSLRELGYWPAAEEAAIEIAATEEAAFEPQAEPIALPPQAEVSEPTFEVAPLLIEEEPVFATQALSFADEAPLFTDEPQFPSFETPLFTEESALAELSTEATNSFAIETDSFAEFDLNTSSVIDDSAFAVSLDASSQEPPAFVDFDFDEVPETQVLEFPAIAEITERADPQPSAIDAEPLELDFSFDPAALTEPAGNELFVPMEPEFNLDLPVEFESQVKALTENDLSQDLAFTFELEPRAETSLSAGGVVAAGDEFPELDFSSLEATDLESEAAPSMPPDFDFSFDAPLFEDAATASEETAAALAPAASLDDFIRRFDLDEVAIEAASSDVDQPRVEPYDEPVTAVEIAEGFGLEGLIIGESNDAASLELPQDLDGLRLGQFELSPGVAEPTFAELAPKIPAPTFVPAKLAVTSGFEVVLSDDIDEEIREVFVEEVEEVLDSLRSAYPAWLADTANFDKLTPIRRAFHTMKGSGRLVGAMALGEFSWRVENMLNRVLDKTIPINSNVLEVLDESMVVLPQFLAALRGQGAPTADIGAVMHAAERLSSGEQYSLKALLAENAAAASAALLADEPEVAAAAVDAPIEEILIEESSIEASSVEAPVTETSVVEPPAMEPPALEEALFEEIVIEPSVVEEIRTEALLSEATSAEATIREAMPIDAESSGSQLIDEPSMWAEVPLFEDAQPGIDEVVSFDPNQTDLVDSLDAATIDLGQASTEAGLGEEQIAADLSEFALLEDSDAAVFADELNVFEELPPVTSAVQDEVVAPSDLFAAHADVADTVSNASELPDLLIEDLGFSVEFAEFEAELGALESVEDPVEATFMNLQAEEAADAFAVEATPASNDEELPTVSLDDLEAAFAVSDFAVEAELGAFDTEITALSAEPESSQAEMPLIDFSEETFAEADFAALDALSSAYLETGADSAEIDSTPKFVEPEVELASIDLGLPGMDPVLLEILKSEVAAHLVVIRDYLSSCSATSVTPVATEALLRAVHTLNGAISMVDVPIISSVMGPLEGYVKRLQQKLEGPTLEGVAAIGDAVQLVEAVIGELEKPNPVYSSDQHLPERLILLRDALPPVDSQAQLSEMQFDDDDDDGVLASLSGDMSELSDEQKAVFADELAALDGLEPSLFTDDSFGPSDEFDALAALEATIAELKTQEPSENSTETDDFLAEDIVDSAELPAFNEETYTSIFADERAVEEAANTDEIVDAQAEIEEPVESDEAFSSFVLSDGGETRFKLSFDADPAGPLDMSDIDSDLLDIFLEEGNEILDTSDGLMARLREAPDDRVQLIGLQRELHTLKGGARMAGLNAVGDLSHSMESLFESITEGRNKVGRQTVEVLESAFDRLHAMMARIARRQAVSQPDSAVEQLEALTRGETLRPIHIEEEAALEEGATSVVAIEGQANSLPAPSTGEEMPGAEIASTPVVQSGVPTPKFVAPKPRRIELKPTKADEDEAAGMRSAQEVVRVRSDLLDNLVNYAGEVSIYRSRLEQQVGSFRTNLVELDTTVSRLRDQLRKLEMETEAQILSRYQREMEDADKDFDPLELDRFSTLQQLSRALAESVSDLSSLQTLLDDVTRQSETLLLQQSRVSSELQEGLMRTRMVPFDSLVPRLRRILRQTAQELDKRAQLRVLGAQGEMDRNVLERMTAPLEHMLRNAIAHGLETPAERAQFGKSEEGTVTIAVSREATEVVLRVSDDGRGLDREAIRRKAIERGLLRPEVNLSDRDLFQFILETGFSTAEVVSKVSGRGVGMDVVGSEIKQLGGSLQIDSTRGKGTIFTVRLPFTLAVTHAIMVRLGEVIYALPLSAVQGVVRVPKADFEKRLAELNPTYTYAGEDYTLQELRSVLGLDIANLADDGQLPVVLVRTGDQRAAVRVDSVLGSREIVVKSVGPQISSVPGIFGATILGDGSVVVILDLAPLLRRSMAVKETRVLSYDAEGLETETVMPVAPVAPKPQIVEDRQPLVMVVDDSITMRKVTTRVLERQDYDVLTAKDGLDAITVMTDRIPDLMLLDIEMPRMDGFELAIHMRNDVRLRGVPIIMITSRTGEKHRQRARELGVTRYLGKPYQEQELLANVKDALKEAHVIE